MSFIPKVDGLIAELQATVTDPAKRVLVEALAVDATRIAATALTNPELAAREAKFVHAQVLNLSAAEALAAQNIIGAWVTRVVVAAVAKALVP